MDPTALAVVIIVVALGFDFTNGFHDSGNAIATSISTRALTPRVALGMAAVMNVVGALISTKVAQTIGGGIIDPPSGTHGLVIVLAALLGAIAWNLLTWWLRAALVVVARPHRRPGRCGAGRLRGREVERRRRQGRRADGGLAADRFRAELPVHARAAVDLPEGQRGPRQPRLPLGPDRLGGDDGLRARHAGRAEDDGRHRADAGGVGAPVTARRHPAVGHPRLGRRDLAGHLLGRLADHAHARPAHLLAHAGAAASPRRRWPARSCSAPRPTACRCRRRTSSARR